MKLRELIKLFKDSDRMRLIRGEQNWTGYCCYINGQQGLPHHLGLTGDEEVEKFSADLHMYHPRWKELGLHEPLEPEEKADYSFKELNARLYNTIYLKPK